MNQEASKAGAETHDHREISEEQSDSSRVEKQKIYKHADPRILRFLADSEGHLRGYN
jgi:hypothetical protein